ncbi:hypothetical protein [Streptomyces sp. NPDC051286]|uniref:hypothetical protein n=1 Tax=Streptomyces sp. NPDC051286 TaxID=3365647 RepID=UPI0037987C53
MEGTAWGTGRDIVNLADMDKDNVPDLLWRNVDNGNMYVRHGKRGAVAGSVDLESLKQVVNSADGLDVPFGTSWTKAAIDHAIGIPDIWARFVADGHMSIYLPSTTNTNPPAKTVIGSGWMVMLAFG